MNSTTADIELRQRELLDQLEISEFIVTNSLLGDNNREGDWQRFSQRYAEQIVVDYSSTLGDPPRALDRERLMPYWKSMIDAFEVNQHRVTNVVVACNGDTASTRAYTVATHAFGKDVWSCHGIYEHALRRAPGEDGGWKITAQRFIPLCETGDRRVFERGIAMAAASPFTKR